MKGIATILTLSVVMVFSSCTWIYAQMISGKVVDDFMSIKSYRGRVVEVLATSAGGGGTMRLVKDVYYKKLWKTRAETIEPEERAGELFIYDGKTLTAWWPRHLFGLRIHGAAPPTDGEFRDAIEANAYWALKHYAFSYQDVKTVARRPAARWKVFPSKKSPFVYPYDSWVDKQYTMPLKLIVRDRPGRVWYSMEYEKIGFGAPIADDLFSFEFPPNAVVFEWNLADPGLPLAEMQKLMNFDILLPRKLPEGIEIRKIIKGRHCLPMSVLLMDDGGVKLSLTEVRSLGRDFDPATGIPIDMGGGMKGYLNFLGAFTSIMWSRGNTSLTLIGNLPYPEMISVAASVGPGK